MKKYEYEILEHREIWGTFYWHLGEEKQGEEYKPTTLLETLNSIGKKGWQVVSRESDESYIVMRETVTL